MHEYKITWFSYPRNSSKKITAVSALAALTVFESRFPHLAPSVLKVEQLPDDED